MIKNCYSNVTINEIDKNFNILYNTDGNAKTYSLKAGEGSRESEIKYTDSVGVITKLINTMINIRKKFVKALYYLLFNTYFIYQ